MLHLAAIGVEDAVVEVGIGETRGLDQQDLVAAHAEMPVRDSTNLLGGQADGAGQGIQHHEIIA
ncbi:hypothetical protein D3C83_37920 [compost metagenome]